MTRDPASTPIDFPAGNPSVATDVPDTQVDQQTADDAAATAAALSKRVGFADDVTAIVGRHLANGPTTETLGLLIQGLTEYSGDQIAGFLVQSLIIEDLDAALEDAGVDLGDKANVDLVPFLHLLRAHFGGIVQRANLMAGQDLDDWMQVTRTAFKDDATKFWAVRIVLTKYSGEKVYLFGPANMAVNLARELFAVLNTIPERTAFGDSELSALLQEVNTFQTKMMPAVSTVAAASVEAGDQRVTASPMVGA
jgi:hypothetical protein